jgi:hypothetical protein
VPQQCIDISHACPAAEHSHRPVIEQRPEQQILPSEQRRFRMMQRQEPR